jgi:glutathione S-transferase
MISHADQKTDTFFMTHNPNGKCPLLVVQDGAEGSTTSLPESSIILSYLDAILSSSPGFQSLTPPDPLLTARMRVITQTHDLYIASPNSQHDGPPYGFNCHAQSCFYVPPPPLVDSGGVSPNVRGLPIEVRALKLRDVMLQLHNLEGMFIESESTSSSFFFLGGQEPTLADLTVYPTLISLYVLSQKTFGWPNEGLGSIFHDTPKLRTLFEGMNKIPWARVVGDGLREAIEGSEVQTGKCRFIKEDIEVNGGGFKWTLPL